MRACKCGGTIRVSQVICYSCGEELEETPNQPRDLEAPSDAKLESICKKYMKGIFGTVVFLDYQAAMKLACEVRDRTAAAARRKHSVHVIPDRESLVANRSVEPEGERLRAELTAWLDNNDIVGIFLDTPVHVVRIDSAKLPPRIRNVLTKWGSIYVKDDREEAPDAKRT